MHIVCPHCTTSYAIDLATVGAAGRTVRCSRCKEVWLARPQDATELKVAAMATAAEPAASADEDDAVEWHTQAYADEDGTHDAPVVDSPSISGDWPSPADGKSSSRAGVAAWAAMTRDDMHAQATAQPRRGAWFRNPLKPPAQFRATGKPFVSLTTLCAGMGALVLAVLIWRVDVVRLMPQTAMFYKMVGLDVNMRGLVFKDVKVTTETVEGKPVLVVEGVIVGEARRAVELPRLRFSVRDAQGAEIYAWNAMLEQPVLKPGEKAWFKSRLASPPPEGRNVDVRFFNKRDLTAGSV